MIGPGKNKRTDSRPTVQSDLAAYLQKSAYFANQQSQQAIYTSQLANQLNQLSPLAKGAGQAAAPPKMNPPKFQPGDKVTVRSGKTIYTVLETKALTEMLRAYYLCDELTGIKVNEVESDLKLYDQTAAAHSKVDFDTVVIDDVKRQQILQAIEQVNQAELIFQKWGFGKTIEKGKGVSMLFYGPPGTGKTLMAQAIANKLDYKLSVIASADIESSAPGEAERNIRKHFKDAKGAGNILLFDECDSLIYSRQHVGAIMGAQINELLSQIERFDGITIFTTNRLGTLDEAVNRRLALKLEFEMPSQEQRAEIWQRMFPKECPVDKKIDWMRLAIVEVSGGYIKNAVLRAARMAAAEDMEDHKKKIRMEHLVQALQLETESMIEFEKAREEHSQGYGRVVGNTIQRGRGGIVKGQ